ncbi:MAG: hypothetical protein Q9160_005195 [Pyrenula sp. 1 TL-2023]
MLTYSGREGHPNLNLSPEEKRYYGQLFRAADPDGFGAVSGDVAVKFFEKTKLHADTLGQIWQIADAENRGFLTPAGFGVVLRLIGHAQAGQNPSIEIAAQSGPLPRFEGYPVPPLSAQNTGPPASPTQPAGAIRVPPLSPEKVSEYAALFEKSGAEGGILSGVTAKQIFERARLPNEVLGRIWNLADTKERGMLDTTEFVIAMHLLASFKSGAMRGVPQSLPAGLYEAASRKGIPRMSTGSRPSSAIPPQNTGLMQNRAQSPIARQQFGTPLSAQSTGDGWLVNPSDKTSFDSIFATIDRANRGFVTGDQAVEFFSNSRLPEETLAQIWDLSDINSEGQLNKDEFAVAMFLIRQQRGKQDGRTSLPATLPPALVPPSMRREQIPPSQTTAPVFDNAANATKPRSAAEDLFGLDALTSSPPRPAQAQERQMTGGSSNQTQRIASPQLAAPAQNTSATFKPFVPSSSFGQSIVPQATGMQTGSASLPRTVPASSSNQASDDLLGDADPEVSRKLTQETSELANLSNQVGTLSKQMQEVQGHRASTERELSQSSQQKRDFESRLSQLRSMYEKEVKDVKSLEERLATSRSDTRKLQQELAMVDGTYQDLKSQHTQITTALEADQRENASLKEKIRVVNSDIASLKPQIEKMNREARQHKGFVAINKKQLSTNEAEKDRLQGDLSTAVKEAEERERSTPVPSSTPGNVLSPAASIASQNTNPFFRRTTTSTSDVISASPGPRQQPPNDPHAAFDSVFGPPVARTPGASTPSAVKNETEPLSRAAGTPQRTSDTPISFKSPISHPNDAGVANQAFPSPPSSNSESSSLCNADPNGASKTAIEPGPASEPPAQDYFPQTSTHSPSVDESTRALPAAQKGSEDNQFGPPSTLRGIPGAFPGFDTPRVETPQAETPTPATSNEPVKAKAANDTFDDFFGGPARTRSSSDQAADFDQAFASLDTKNNNIEETQAPSSSEFPPIQEFEGDDSDDSSDDQQGFDDDFAPASSQPPQAEPVKLPTSTDVEAPANHLKPDQLPSRPTTSTTGEPPRIEAQTSPPAYDQSVSQDVSHFPPEFNGLLPSREDPTSPKEPPHSIPENYQAPGAKLSQQHTPDATDAFAPGSRTDIKTTQNGSAGDDFDAVFANVNMAPANQADDDEDQDELNDSFASASNHVEGFNPTFDSTVPPTIPPRPNGSSHEIQKPEKPATSNNDFYDFESSLSAAQPSPLPATQSANNQSHDWDAIFAGLDAPAPSAVTNMGTDQVNTPSFPPPPASTTKDASGRPAPGRALSTGTEHDDPILKRLTGMGWQREESLSALEKYDYNLDKAVDYLASKS